MNESVRFQYFQHQLNARKDEKLRKLLIKEGWEGIGLFWGLLEELGLNKEHRLQTDYEELSFDMHASAEKIQHVVENYGLFKVQKGYFYNSSLTGFLDDLEEKYKKRAAAGKKGGAAKAMLKQSQSNATAMPEQCQPPKEKIREEEIREDNHACYSPSSTAEAENKHDAVALSNEANADNNDATTESFNFSEEVNDREYLAITREFMLKYAAAPTQFTDRLIALMAPDQWKGSRGTDFSNKKWYAANLLKVELPDKYRNGRGGQCTKAEREMVDLWLTMLQEAGIYDRRMIDVFRGMYYDEATNQVQLTVVDKPAAHYIEANHVQALSPVFRRLYGPNVGLQYTAPQLTKEEK